MTDKWPGYDYRYSIIPGGAVTDKRLSLRDLQILALLGRHTKRNGWCWRSQVEMAKEIDCGRATVSRSIKRLIETGWLEAKPLPRGRTELKEGQQPFSAFRYRVIIDRPDEEVEHGDVPNIGHPPSDQPNNGQEVPAIGGHEVPIQVGTHRRINSKDQLNAPAREPWPAIWEAFQTWPNLPDTATEERAKQAWARMASELPDPATLIGLIRAQGDRLRSGAGKRGGWATAPHNWLERDRGWADARTAQNEAIRASEALMAKRDRIIASLGADVLAKLRRAGLRQAEIDLLDGVMFEDFPRPRFLCPTAFIRNRLGEHSQRLDTIWPGIRCDVTDERRSA